MLVGSLVGLLVVLVGVLVGSPLETTPQPYSPYFHEKGAGSFMELVGLLVGLLVVLVGLLVGLLAGCNPTHTITRVLKRER